ncbi:MAG: ABC transporter ATP-binding protein [Planctomycetota bacterium]|nr:MAG: ABC transporter ATP-binding protein [Planctomycetota bacterium]
MEPQSATTTDIPLGHGKRLAVRISGIKKQFGKGEQAVEALRGVTWDVAAQEVAMLVGPSGCGKTTLISVVAGILNADQGTVSIFGESITSMSDRAKTRYRALNVGFVFQQYNLLPALTAAENAAVPLLIQGVPRLKAVKAASELLGQLGLGKRTHSRPNQLSGGQQQRVAIARALIHKPKILVCDEPTAALDHETGMIVMKLIRELAVSDDRAVIVVTHDNRIFPLGDRVAHMDDGHIESIVDGSGRPIPATIEIP